MKTWNRNTIDLEKYENKSIVIHCDTEEKANDLLKYLDEQGIKWRGGLKLAENNYYGIYKEFTCYNYEEFGCLSFSPTDWYIDAKYNIVEWEIVDENQQENIERKTHLYEINGMIETDMDIDELNDKFIDFIESINSEFAGGIK